MFTRRRFLSLPLLAGCARTVELPVVSDAGPDVAGGPRVATFHYGGTIPSTWPPTTINQEPDPLLGGSALPVTPPYLVSAPDYSINIDTGHQTFVDSFLVSTSSNVTTTYHAGIPVAENPVSSPTEAQENDIAISFSDGIYPTFPGSKQLFRLYVAGVGLPYTYRELSDDYGLHWHSKRVVINHGTYPGSGITMRDSASLIYDPNDPSRPWVFAHTNRFTDAVFVMASRRSHDGINWSPVLSETDLSVVDRSTVFYNPYRSLFVYSLRYQSVLGRRYRRYHETSDIVGNPFSIGDSAPVWDTGHWDWRASGTSPTGYDADYMYNITTAPELYNRDMTAEVWGPQGRSLLSHFVVWDTIHDAGGSPVINRPKWNTPVMGFSRDGFYVDRRHGVFPFGREGSSNGSAVDGTRGRNPWDWGNKQSTGGPFIDMGNGRWRHFCSGRRGVVGDSGNSDSGQMAMGAFDWRADGFASLLFGTGGTMTTRTLTHSSNRNVLYVNADVPRTSQLKVEVLKSDGTVAPGCALADCAPISVDSTKHLVTFDARRIAKPDIPDTFKLRFVSTGPCRLYSFWTASEGDRGTTT